MNKTGAYLLGGRLIFLLRCNGSSLRVTRVLPGETANASTALATFAERPSHRSDAPPFPLPNSSVLSPVAHQNKSGVDSSCRTRNAVARTNDQNSRVPWGTGRKHESMSSGSSGVAATTLSPGGIFMVKKKKKTVVDINHLHGSLTLTHSSMLKTTAQQYGIQLVGELAPCSGCPMAKGIRALTPHHTRPGQWLPRNGAHRHRGTIPGVPGGLAIYRYIRGQRFTPSAPVRGPGQERIRHCRCGETFRGRHGSPVSLQDRQRRRVHQFDVR